MFIPKVQLREAGERMTLSFEKLTEAIGMDGWMDGRPKKKKKEEKKIRVLKWIQQNNNKSNKSIEWKIKKIQNKD